jgi:hypothetical protein
MMHTRGTYQAGENGIADGADEPGDDQMRRAPNREVPAAQPIAKPAGRRCRSYNRRGEQRRLWPPTTGAPCPVDGGRCNVAIA